MGLVAVVKVSALVITLFSLIAFFPANKCQSTNWGLPGFEVPEAPDGLSPWINPRRGFSNTPECRFSEPRQRGCNHDDGNDIGDNHNYKRR